MRLRYLALAAVLVGLLLPSLVMPGERYRGPGMMWDGGLFHMFFGFLMLILFLAIVVGVVVLLVRWLGGSEHPLFRPTGQTSRTALDILKERLARGEIDVAEFEERKRALGDQPLAVGSRDRPIEGGPVWRRNTWRFSAAHMVEVIAIHDELASDVLGKTALDERVVAAMGRVPRHAFVPAPLLRQAYDDMPLPIGFDKTISQPFMVALMTDLLEPRPEELDLEVGTGLGYQAAILAELSGRVWTIEIVEELATEAEERLLQLGYTNIGIRVGDGGQGWLEHAPFDKILLSAAAESCPPALVAQLRPGGRMVLPIGVEGDQRLSVVEKDARGGIDLRTLMPVRFSQLETVR